MTVAEQLQVGTQGFVKNKVVVSLIVLLVLFAGAAGFLGFKYYKLRQDPQKVAQEEVKALVAKVGRLIVLPEGEDPTLATVSTPEKLKDQPFFANAKAGDKVLIYTRAKKAILYNPESNRIVEVAPLNIGNTPAAATGTKAPAATNTGTTPKPTTPVVKP